MRSVMQGAAALLLGLLVLTVAGVECFVFADISAPASGANTIFGLSPGTMAYLAGYTGAGIILAAVGIWKICRA